MIIVAIAWIYVVLLMALTEHSIVAGVMTFIMYCVVPLSIIVYLFGAPQRKRRRQIREKLQNLNQSSLPVDNPHENKQPEVASENQLSP